MSLFGFYCCCTAESSENQFVFATAETAADAVDEVQAADVQVEEYTQPQTTGLIQSHPVLETKRDTVQTAPLDDGEGYDSVPPPPATPSQQTKRPSEVLVAANELAKQPTPPPPARAQIAPPQPSKAVADRRAVSEVDDATTTSSMGGETGEPITLGLRTVDGRIVDITLQYKPIGIDFVKESPIVIKQVTGHAAEVGAEVGSTVVYINGEDVRDKDFAYQYSLIRSASKWLPRTPFDPKSEFDPKLPRASTAKSPARPQQPPATKSMSKVSSDVDDRTTTTGGSGGDTGEPLVLGLQTKDGRTFEATLRYRPIGIDFEREAPIVIKKVNGHAVPAGVVVGSTVVSINGEDVRNAEFPYQFGLLRTASKWLPKAA
eukprot:gnl/TRDRNA2_/TRDRNA2_173577_c1_seq3.p1 gnl/TRDRNA2_/TRDRNA2_173577_c1~~gnl/TRDRNA2_/TRDRNA2_173577_c1_seq3.p1  ORF type:complete len:409 (+),score=72.60 gnl/TRDRNA2_/TRDRNA2_173577_c1_seq3:103-1227(+)